MKITYEEAGEILQNPLYLDDKVKLIDLIRHCKTDGAIFLVKWGEVDMKYIKILLQKIRQLNKPIRNISIRAYKVFIFTDQSVDYSEDCYDEMLSEISPEIRNLLLYNPVYIVHKGTDFHERKSLYSLSGKIKHLKNLFEEPTAHIKPKYHEINRNKKNC